MATFAIRIEDTDESFPCHAEQTVLEGMVRLGRRGIPLGCRGGGCGVCRIEVVSGSYSTRVMSRSHISEDDERAGRVLACRIRPQSDLALRLLGVMKRGVVREAQGN